MRQNNMRFFVAALFCMLFVLTGCGGQTQKTAAESGPGFVKAMTPEERADAILARMTPAEKIGQLLMIGVHGTELNADSRFMLSEYAVGGVILFDRNLETAAGVRAFTKELQEARHGDLPLFIAIDEEGGLVTRMKDILPPPPAATRRSRPAGTAQTASRKEKEHNSVSSRFLQEKRDCTSQSL